MLTGTGTWVEYEADEPSIKKPEYKHQLLEADYYDTWMFVSTWDMYICSTIGSSGSAMGMIRMPEEESCMCVYPRYAYM